jgi:hypothetical protein
VTNRITNHIPQPEPEPERNGGGDPDLTKGELSKLPKEETDDMAKASSPDASAEYVGGPDKPAEPTVSERLEGIRERQEVAAAEGRREALTADDIDLLVDVTNRYREQKNIDQSKAPPVDLDLVRRHVAGELPEELDLTVIDLGMLFDNWQQAILDQELKAIAAKRNAENN